VGTMEELDASARRASAERGAARGGGAESSPRRRQWRCAFDPAAREGYGGLDLARRTRRAEAKVEAAA